MKLETILDAARNSCKSAQERNWVESLQWYPGVAEPGYTELSDQGVVLANWNRLTQYNSLTREREVISYLPERVCKVLEKAGIEIEWSDEWTSCDDCARILRTQPDSYFWKPVGKIDLEKGTCLCPECAKEAE